MIDWTRVLNLLVAPESARGPCCILSQELVKTAVQVEALPASK